MQCFHDINNMKYKLMLIFVDIFCYFPVEEKQEKYLRKKEI